MKLEDINAVDWWVSIIFFPVVIFAIWWRFLIEAIDIGTNLAEKIVGWRI